MTFELRAATSLTGPRVYSTEFHPRSIMGGGSDELALGRSLKVKLLTKGVVTINGGHLLNPAAFNFVAANPALLTRGMLLPAIREDKGGFQAYVPDNAAHYQTAKWTNADIANAVDFLNAHVSAVLPWKVEQAQEHYRERLVWGLTAEGSFARRRLLQLEGYGPKDLARLAEAVSKADLREDAAVDRIIAAEPVATREALTKFADAAYHLVGTSVVNCETGLDVSALAERRFAELGAGDIYADANLLTDANVFIRCCFETAMQAINETAFPTHVLDVLPFDAIAKIRTRLSDQGFQDAYDQVIRTFTDRLSNTGVTDIESWQPDETTDLVAGLTKHFRTYLDDELPGYRKAIQEQRMAEAISSGVSTAKGVGGSVPGIGEVISVLDVVHEGANALKAAGEAIAFRDHETANKAARAHRDEMMDAALKALSPRNEAKILTGLRQLRAIAAEWQKPF